MKKIKLVMVLFVITAIYSCTNENTDIEANDKFNIAKEYEKVINSENPKQEFENYTENEKAKLWEYKYELFEQKSKLSNIQKSIINELKSIAIQTLTNNSVKNETIEIIQSKIMNNFDNAQYFDLLYFLDNPSLKSNANKNCFWCTMFSTSGPCFYDGHGGFIQHATFYNCRFWHCHEVASTGTVPCQNQD